MTILRSKRGETLVEVTCACLLLVLALGGLLGAVRFSGGVYARQSPLFSLQQSLAAAGSAGPVYGTADYEFTEYSPDDPGEETLFTVTVSLGSKLASWKAEDGDEKTVAFRFFACPEGAP